MNNKSILIGIAIIFSGLVVFVVPSNVYATAPINVYTSEAAPHGGEEDHVDFAAQIEFIRGHLQQAVANKEANEINLAKAHAGHPIVEHFDSMAPEILKHNKALHDELETALEQLFNKVEILSNADFKKEVDKINVLLENVIRASLSSSLREDTVFWAKVAIELLETADYEYEEAISEVGIEEMVEYQDAQGFVIRAEAVFKGIANKTIEHEHEEIELSFIDLKNAIASMQSPEQVSTLIEEIVHEFREIESPPQQKIEIPTNNGSVNVEVIIDNGTVDDKSLTIDPPQPVRFDIRFLDPATGQPLQHVNYNFMITDEEGISVMNSANMHTHEGVDVQSVPFSNTGSFTLVIDIAGLGINKPYDTKHSGMASISLTVVPEFPSSVLVIMTAVVGMGIAATRFKNPLL